MINSVRQTVLGLLNKNNFGYIGPFDFNQFAKQAQMELFEEYFVRYNATINAENARQSGTGYAGSSLPLQEVIDSFSVTEPLVYDVDQGGYDLTTLTNTPYELNRIAYVGSNYEAENIPPYKINLLVASPLTSPSLSFPAFVQQGTTIAMYPATEQDISVTYLRYPKDPQWTFIDLQQGEPLFNESATDYQDFELPIEDEYRLIQKICQYCGLSIRETEVIQYAKNEENETMAKG